MHGENVSLSTRAMLVKPKSLRMGDKEGSEPNAPTEKIRAGAETSKEIRIRVPMLVSNCFLFLAFFLEVSLLLLLNLISAR